MNIKDLKESIEELPDDMEVAIQHGFSHMGLDLREVDLYCIMLGPEIFDIRWSASDAGMKKAEWEKALQRPRVLVLAP